MPQNIQPMGLVGSREAISAPTTRAAYLKETVGDARQALSLAECSGTTPAANEAAALLSKIVSEDVEEGPARISEAG